MVLQHTTVWLDGRAEGGSPPALREASLPPGAEPMRVRVSNLPPGSVCAVWAADPLSAPTLDASYHIKGKVERMPDPKTFPNIAVRKCDERGQLVTTLANPLHGYASRQGKYRLPPHVHLRCWLDGTTSRTFTFALAA